MKKEILLFIVLFTILLAYNAKASSLGVTPAYYEVNFEPGLKQDFVFNFNTDNNNLDFEIYAEGDLAQYITLDKNQLKGSGTVNAHLELPQTIEKPGKHALLIGAKQLAPERQSFIGIVANVRAAIFIYVPYPGKYAETNFDIKDANAGENVSYELIIYSRGKEEINTNTQIEIFNSENKSLDSFNIGSDKISAGESVDIKSRLNLGNYNPGNYKAKAAVNYGAGRTIAEDNFRLGELLISITNYTMEFERNKLNPFIVEVESSWNDPIENVFAGITILETGENILTPSAKVEKFSRTRLQGYFDTSKIKNEEFQAKIVLNYAGKTTEKIVNLKLEKKKFNYLWILASLIVLLIFITAFFVLRKKIKNGKKKHK